MIKRLILDSGRHLQRFELISVYQLLIFYKIVYCVVDGGSNLESKVGPLYIQATTTLCMKAGEMLDLTKKDIILQFSIPSV